MASVQFAADVSCPGRTLWRISTQRFGILSVESLVTMPLPGYRPVAQTRLQLGLCDVDAVAAYPARPCQLLRWQNPTGNCYPSR